jgi:hypothetical protein
MNDRHHISDGLVLTRLSQYMKIGICELVGVFTGCCIGIAAGIPAVMCCCWCVVGGVLLVVCCCWLGSEP